MAGSRGDVTSQPHCLLTLYQGLHISAGQGHVENCQYLIDRTGGTIASVLDSRGRTALHSATENGQLESMKYLLSLGFSADYQDNDGRRYVCVHGVHTDSDGRRYVCVHGVHTDSDGRRYVCTWCAYR